VIAARLEPQTFRSAHPRGTVPPPRSKAELSHPSRHSGDGWNGGALTITSVTPTGPSSAGPFSLSSGASGTVTFTTGGANTAAPIAAPTAAPTSSGTAGGTSSSAAGVSLSGTPNSRRTEAHTDNKALLNLKDNKSHKDSEALLKDNKARTDNKSHKDSEALLKDNKARKDNKSHKDSEALLKDNKARKDNTARKDKHDTK
jgi:hypothetical protein